MTTLIPLSVVGTTVVMLMSIYKPRGENLDYYDVNSLYPYVMKNYPMPIGKAKWNGDLHGKKIEDLSLWVSRGICRMP